MSEQRHKSLLCTLCFVMPQSNGSLGKVNDLFLEMLRSPSPYDSRSHPLFLSPNYTSPLLSPSHTHAHHCLPSSESSLTFAWNNSAVTCLSVLRKTRHAPATIKSMCVSVAGLSSLNRSFYVCPLQLNAAPRESATWRPGQMWCVLRSHAPCKGYPHSSLTASRKPLKAGRFPQQLLFSPWSPPSSYILTCFQPHVCINAQCHNQSFSCVCRKMQTCAARSSLVFVTESNTSVTI